MDGHVRVAGHAGHPVSLARVTGQDDAVSTVPVVGGLDDTRGAIAPGQRGSDIETVGEDFSELWRQIRHTLTLQLPGVVCQ